MLTKTGFGLWSGGNQARQLGPTHGSCTHGAGFNGNVEGTFWQVFVPQIFAGCRDGQHFCMSSRVVQLLGEVVTSPDDALVRDHNGSDGDFSPLERFFSFPEGLLHEVLVAMNRKHGVHLQSH